MLPRRAVRVRPALRSIKEQELPTDQEVQTQEEIKYADFREAIRMLSQAATYHVWLGDNRHEVVDTSRIRELLSMNPPSFTGSSVTENPENLKGAEDALAVSWVVFEGALMGRFFPRELREVDMRSRMSLYVAGLSRQSSKEGKAAMLIGDIDLERFIIHLQQVAEDKLKDREEFKDKRAKINKDGCNRNFYNFTARLVYPQGSMVPRGSKPLACAKCGRNHSGICREGSISCFKCGQSGHFMRQCPKNRQGSGNLSSRAQASSVAPPDRMVPRGVTSSMDGGANCLYAINSRQEQQDSPDVVTGMIRVFDFAVFSLLDSRVSLYFEILYVAMNFDVIPEQPSESVIEWSSSSADPRGCFFSYLEARNCQKQEDSPDVVTSLIRVFDFAVFALLDSKASLSFVIPYVAMNFDVKPEQPSEPVIEWSSCSTVPRGRFFSYLEARKVEVEFLRDNVGWRKRPPPESTPVVNLATLDPKIITPSLSMEQSDAAILALIDKAIQKALSTVIERVIKFEGTIASHALRLDDLTVRVEAQEKAGGISTNIDTPRAKGEVSFSNSPEMPSTLPSTYVSSTVMLEVSVDVEVADNESKRAEETDEELRDEKHGTAKILTDLHETKIGHS
ncbi:uncharacterized protein LOC125863689 [Solanum stenotomum]|uniref:uncharacterized protein LOC125863689 n=1 Tax=Solanum stenotomum TaxID=172797 RepID=UPI0020D08678|nr:uncharacterized protein LOC125863689 [Solanum stenotomum]